MGLLFSALTVTDNRSAGLQQRIPSKPPCMEGSNEPLQLPLSTATDAVHKNLACTPAE